jgi:hypothetical protein
VGWFDWLRSLFAPGRDGFNGLRGDPPSGNGASSFHVWWQVPPTPLREVGVTFEILEPPRASRLYFWALQVTFGAGPPGEGAHLGIQHHPGFPGSGAANWGGYKSQADGGGLLDGTPSPLPSFRNDPNTRDFDWAPRTPYRFRIAKSHDPAPPGFVAWSGSIQDLGTGQRFLVRDLFTRGSHLLSPVMWTESFARCEHPSVAVRWSDPEAIRTDGTPIVPDAFRVEYQDLTRGGCLNTNVTSDPGGIVQRTSTDRTVPPGPLVRRP